MRSCTAIAVASLCVAVQSAPSKWSSSDIDECVRIVDQLYVNSVMELQKNGEFINQYLRPVDPVLGDLWKKGMTTFEVSCRASTMTVSRVNLTCYGQDLGGTCDDELLLMCPNELPQYSLFGTPQLSRKLTEDEKEAFRAAKRARLGKGENKIPGRAGIDYPTYHEAPHSSFTCSNAPISPGIYADVESACQAYRVCDTNRQDDHGAVFLCPNGTLFNQKEFSCDWWYNVDCAQAPHLYSLNLDPEHNPYVPKKKSEDELQEQQIYQQPLQQVSYQQLPRQQVYQPLPQNYRSQAYQHQPQIQPVYQQQQYQPQISQYSQQTLLASHGNFDYHG